MSTRSTIAILNKDGSVSSVYCHSDGYLSFNGMLLARYYQDVEKVKKLISFGSMSSLGEEVDPPQGSKHTFDKRIAGVTTFYGRDRGETDMEPTSYGSFEEYVASDNFEQYDYVFNEAKNSWFLLKSNGKLTKLLPLLAKSAEITGENKMFVTEALNAVKVMKLKTKIEKAIPEKPTTKESPKVKV